MMSKDDPQLTVLHRRRFLKLVGAGASITTAVGLGVILTSRDTADSAIDLSSEPVRNPAFREIPGDAPGHMVLYCQTSTNDTLAFDLNQQGFQIWNHCVSHHDFTKGIRKSLAQFPPQLASDSQVLTGFVSLMLSKGLLFLANGDSQVYFEFQEAY